MYTGDGEHSSKREKGEEARREGQLGRQEDQLDDRTDGLARVFPEEVGGSEREANLVIGARRAAGRRRARVGSSRGQEGGKG